MSSSPVPPLTCSGSLTRSAAPANSLSSTPSTPQPPADTAVGPIQLPLEDPLDFIAQFNRIYGPIGLQIIAAQAQRTLEPATPAATLRV